MNTTIENKVINFMEGINFNLSPIIKLKFILASSIFGEPQYYRSGEKKQAIADKILEKYYGDLIFDPYNESNVDLTLKAIDDALDYDFEATLEIAEDLRNKFLMRKNPRMIIMKAALHKNRVDFNSKNPNKFRTVMKNVCSRPDDMLTQLNFYKKMKGDTNSVKSLPNIIKRGWADVLESLNKYQLKKYLNSANIIDLIRLSHPNPEKNELLIEIIKTGDIKIENNEQTWERLKSSGKNWIEILNQIGVPHMALLRNLRNIVIDLVKHKRDVQDIKDIMSDLIKGVEHGKQFPFRYYTAYVNFHGTNHIEHCCKKKAKKYSNNYNNKQIEFNELCKTNPEFVQIVKDGLESCIDESIKNFPSIEGSTVSLCDNSGSAHSTFNSTYGSVKVSTIANLSALITSYKTSGKGYVGIFGDRLVMYEVNKSRKVLEQLNEIEQIGSTIGLSTENGIWLWFDSAFKKPNDQAYNPTNLFIYSDQQAGHGGLYGTNQTEYDEYRYGEVDKSHYVDVLMLLKHYRKIVNPKLNIWSVQVAGYDNSILPECLYRGALLSGWTGNEVMYASELTKLWDSIEEVKIETSWSS